MAIVAGIDEAGLGPVVGPLVISASVFRVADADVDGCLWRRLAGAVTRRVFRKSSALPIADSKTMHVRSDGVLHLERGVLGVLTGSGPPPATLREFLRRHSPATPAEMEGYPWYAGADLPLPRQADATDVRLRANAFGEAMARAGVAFQGLRVEPVLEGSFNRLIHATRNKSVALMGVVGRLVAWVFHTHSDGSPMRLVVDRLGGRVRYLQPLMRMFPEAAVKIVEETPQRSAYLVRQDDRSMSIAFQVDADADDLPTALASMASKYARELFMELLNAWWMARIAGLKPTAGYHPDGVRFLKDIDSYVSARGIDKSLLVRCR